MVSQRLVAQQQTAQADLLLDERGERQVVEQVGEVLPHVGIAVFARALVVESVHCSASKRTNQRSMVSLIGAHPA